MKQSTFVILALFGLFLGGCNRENITTDSTDDFSSMVELSAARASATNDSVTKQKCKGKLTDVATKDLPAAIMAYLTKNYAGAEIQFAGKDATGQFVVGLKVGNTHTGLLFNADGTFKEVLKRYEKGAKLTKVEAAALPAAITTYITAKYAGATVKHAGKAEDGSYYVAIEQGTTKKVLQFDAAGVFKQEMTPPAHPMGKKR